MQLFHERDPKKNCEEIGDTSQEKIQMSLIHKNDQPIGWERRQDGRTYPVWICAITRQPIGPENSGTLYWCPDTGEMMVLSCKAEDILRESDRKRLSDIEARLPYTTELDVHSFQLLANTVDAPAIAKVRETAELLGTIE